MCKRAASPYRRRRRSKSWLKLKQRETAEVLVRFGARDRESGLIERAAFTEPDRPGLQWAVVHHGGLRRELERGARDLPGVVAYSHRDACGRRARRGSWR